MAIAIKTTRGAWRCPLHGGLQEVDYRSKTFSCSQFGNEAYLAVIEPIKEAGMQDYRLDAIERPERTPQPLIGSRVEALARRSTIVAVICRGAKSKAVGSGSFPFIDGCRCMA